MWYCEYVRVRVRSPYEKRRTKRDERDEINEKRYGPGGGGRPFAPAARDN